MLVFFLSLTRIYHENLSRESITEWFVHFSSVSLFQLVHEQVHLFPSCHLHLLIIKSHEYLVKCLRFAMKDDSWRTIDDKLFKQRPKNQPKYAISCNPLSRTQPNQFLKRKNVYATYPRSFTDLFYPRHSQSRAKMSEFPQQEDNDWRKQWGIRWSTDRKLSMSSHNYYPFPPVLVTVTTKSQGNLICSWE